MEQKTQKNKVKGIFLKWQVFRRSRLKICTGNVSPRRFQHRLLDIDSGHLKAQMEEGFSKDTAAGSDIKNRPRVNPLKTKPDNLIGFQKSQAFWIAEFFYWMAVYLIFAHDTNSIIVCLGVLGLIF